MRTKFLLFSFMSFSLWCLVIKANAQGGTLPLNGSVNGTLASSTTTDTWNLTTTGDGLVRLTFQSTGASNADMFVSLFDNNGTTLLAGPLESYNNSTVMLPVDGLAAGTYRVKITPYSVGSVVGTYTLSDNLFTPTQPNDAEPNNSRATSLTLPLNDSAKGHLGYYYNNYKDTSDWYKVTTNADGLLRVTLSTAHSSIYSTNPLDVNLYVYDNDGTTLLGSVEVYNGNIVNPATGSLILDGLAAGTYFVKIQPYQPNTEFAAYTLSDSLFIPTQPNDVEPNNSSATALTLPQDDSTKGHVGYYYNNYKDTSDWYKITTNADGLLRVTLSTAHSSIYSTNPLDVNLYVYDNDGTTLLGSVDVYNGNIVNPATGSVTLDGLAAGTYFVKIQPYHPNTEFAAYTLSDSLFTYNPNDPEPNNIPSPSSTILTNRTTTGHISFRYNGGGRDVADWFKVNYTGVNGGSIKFILNLLPHLSNGALGDVFFQVYSDTSAAPIFNQEFFTAPSNTFTISSLTQGYYWIKIIPYSANPAYYSAYSITDSFPQVNIAQIAITKAKSSSVCNSDTLAFQLTGSHSPYGVTLYRFGVIYDSVNTATDSAVYRNLPPGIYYATVYGDGATDLAHSTNAVSSFLPPTPIGLNTTNITVNSATINWTPQSCVNFDSVQYRIKGSSTWITVHSNTNNYNLSALQVDTIYYFRVASVDSANGQSVFSPYSLADSFRTYNPLPVTFIKFDGVLQNASAVLNWSTANEFNNKGFQVQRSANGLAFNDIGFVNGAGNSSLINKYNYTDIKVLNGSNYYRLKQIDLDGRSDYSSVIRLDYTEFDWTILGNPISNNSWVLVQMDKTADVIVQVVGINGNVIQTINKGKIASGSYSIPLHLNNVSSGIYVVRLIVDGKNYSRQIIK